MCIGPGSAEPWSRTLIHPRFPSFTFSILPLGAPLHSFLRVGVGGDAGWRGRVFSSTLAYSPRLLCTSVVGVGDATRLGSLLPTFPSLSLVSIYISKYRPPNSSHRTVFQFQPPSIAPAPAQFFYISGIFFSCSEFLLSFSSQFQLLRSRARSYYQTQVSLASSQSTVPTRSSSSNSTCCRYKALARSR